jgi:uncharacterized coiled-coil protein SlyX
MNFRCKKAIQGLVVISAVWMMSACEALNQFRQQANNQHNATQAMCVSPEHEDAFGAFCKPSTWLQFLLEVQALTWPERMQSIDDLGDEPVNVLKKILLSQGADTPYQDRLRAQNWIVKISGDTSQVMQVLLTDLIYENSKQLLEFESAITILSRVNSRQEKLISQLELTLSEREQKIQKQQDQVEQLLKIETDLIEQNRNEKR